VKLKKPPSGGFFFFRYPKAFDATIMHHRGRMRSQKKQNENRKHPGFQDEKPQNLSDLMYYPFYGFCLPGIGGIVEFLILNGRAGVACAREYL
jgi:hypothetical protein